MDNDPCSAWVAVIALEFDDLGDQRGRFEDVVRSGLPSPGPRIYYDGWSDESVDVIVDAPSRDAALELAERTLGALSASGLVLRVGKSLALRKAGGAGRAHPATGTGQ